MYYLIPIETPLWPLSCPYFDYTPLVSELRLVLAPYQDILKIPDINFAILDFRGFGPELLSEKLRELQVRDNLVAPVGELTNNIFASLVRTGELEEIFLSSAIISQCHHLGIFTVNELLRIPHQELGARFSQLLVRYVAEFKKPVTTFYHYIKAPTSFRRRRNLVCYSREDLATQLYHLGAVILKNIDKHNLYTPSLIFKVGENPPREVRIFASKPLAELKRLLHLFTQSLVLGPEYNQSNELQTKYEVTVSPSALAPLIVGSELRLRSQEYVARSSIEGLKLLANTQSLHERYHKRNKSLLILKSTHPSSMVKFVANRRLEFAADLSIAPPILVMKRAIVVGKTLVFVNRKIIIQDAELVVKRCRGNKLLRYYRIVDDQETVWLVRVGEICTLIGYW